MRMRSPRRTLEGGHHWAIVRIVVFGVVGAALALTGLVLLATRDDHGPAGAALGAGTLLLGAALVTVAKFLLPPPEQTEVRHAPGSPACQGCHAATTQGQRRRLVVGGSAVAVVGAVGGGALLNGSTDARRALRETSWRRGDALVTEDGTAVSSDDVEAGAMLTVWPEHSIGASDSQVVLIRLDPERLDPAGQTARLSADGLVAYSKLCTHMGCPMGLYQQDPDVLVCPCHQAVFDVLDGARPVHGPARRPLPQLPLDTGDDGVLRAAGPFTDTVGPSWWGRPR